MLRETLQSADSNAILFFGFLLVGWVVLLLFRADALWVLAVLGVLAFTAWLLERTGILGRSSESVDEPATEQRESEDPIERLKRRYANGEISESEFEGRLDRLLGTNERLGGSSAARSKELEFER